LAAARASLLTYLRSLHAADPAVTDRELLHRFVHADDQAAFRGLMQRHGPLVWNVCRRLLGDGPAAEDAFQATFLVLLRRAAAIAEPERLGCWLHGVARRTALQARMRRQRRDPLPADWPAAPQEDWLWHDLRGVLDAEIARLPLNCREPFILCCLEGMTHAAAAQRLGWPRATVATRLTRARERLRAGLTRRGVTLTTAALTAGLAASTLGAAPPVHWQWPGDGPGPGMEAEILAKGVVRTMTATKSIRLAGLVLLASLAGWAVLATVRSGPPGASALNCPTPAEAAASAPRPAPGPAQVTIGTRFLSASPALLARLRQDFPALGGPGTAGPDASALLLLSREELRRILTLVQNDRGAALESAPTVTTFDGHEARVAVGGEHVFVTGAEVVHEDGQFRLTPRRQTFATGLTLTMLPTVAATEERVGIDVDVQLTELAPGPVPQAAVEVKLPAGAAAPPPQLVQAPRFERLAWQARVDLPPDAVALQVIGTRLRPAAAEDQVGPPETEWVLLIIDARAQATP